MKFVCDAMLHKLCVWLRMAGHECFFAPFEDDEVIKIALKLNAVLLTCDKRLAQKAGGYCKVQLLKSKTFTAQLKEVVKQNKVKLKFSQRFCTVCGGELKKVSKQSVKKRVWPFTYKTHKHFLQCKQCKHIFWRGSHWKKIKNTLVSISTCLTH